MRKMKRMKKTRRTAAVVLAFSMALSLAPVQTPGAAWTTAQAAETTEEGSQQSGDFCYAVRADGMVKITGYTGSKKYVSIPGTIEDKTVTEIGKNVFRNKKIARVKIADSVTEIADEAFANCNRLISVTLPEQLKKIGDYAFSMCNRLKKIEIPETVEKIGDGAFFYCSAMKTAVVKGVPTTLGSYIFSDCTSLSDLQFEKEWEEIPEGMFYDCECLQYFEQAEQIKKIGDRAFANCGGLYFETLNNLQEIDDSALSSIGGVQEMTISENCKVGEAVLQNSYVETLTIRTSTLDQDVLSDARINKLILDAGVDASVQKSIQKVNVTDFDVAEDNTELAEYNDSLYNKDKTELLKYRTVTLSGSDDGSEDQEREEKLDLADGTRKIDAYACYGYGSNSRIIIPDSVEAIGEGAFSNASLTGVQIPDSVKKIEDDAFANDYGLTAVKLGDQTKTIGDRAFLMCYGLSDLKGEEAVTSIGEEAFCDCSELKEFSISDQLKTIGEGAFQNTSIEEFTISDEQPYFKEIKGALVTKDGKDLVCMAPGADVSIPDGVTRLLSRSVPASSEVVVPDGVTELEDHAIQGIAGQEVTIPDSVKKIGKEAIGYVLSRAVGTDEQVIQNIIYSAGMTETAKKYAKDHDIAIAEGKTDINKEEVELNGNETFQVRVPGLPEDLTCYTSADNEIASVSDRGEITAHKKGTTYVTVSIGDRAWYTKVTVTGDGTPYASSYDLSSYVNPAENAKAWCDDYKEANSNYEFSQEEDPNTTLYSGSVYVPMKALLEYGQEYVSKAETIFGKNYKRYDQINKNLTYELSGFNLHTNTIFYSGVRTAKNLTGASESVLDMKASIGKKGVYNCITSTSYDRSVASGFMWNGRGSTMLELYVPKGYSKGAYISDYSEYESESEYLMDTGFHYEILDAGIRTCERSEEDGGGVTTERFIKLLIQPDKQEPDVTPSPSPSTSPSPSPSATPDNGKKPAAKAVQKKVKGVTYKASGKKAVVVKAEKSLKNTSIPSKIKIKGKTYSVTGIQAGAFKNCKKLKKITLGNSIRSIGKDAFKNIYAKAVFKVKKKYYSNYKKLLTKRTGYKKTMKIKL